MNVDIQYLAVHEPCCLAIQSHFIIGSLKANEIHQDIKHQANSGG